MDPRPLLAILLIPLAACSSGGSGGSSAAAADLFVTDATVDDLLAFQATVDDVRLRRADQTTSANLLAAPARFDFLELEDRLGWVSTADVAPGDYDAIVLGFVPGSCEAMAQDGSAVTVNALGNRLVALFASALAVDGGYLRLEVDLDLAASLSGDVSSGSIDFDPTGSSRSSDGSGSAAIDEIEGVVLSTDQAAGELVLDAFVDDDSSIPLGEITVQLQMDTLLLEEDGAPFASQADFFATLVANVSLLEVHGLVGAGGLVEATRIEIEDELGGGGPVAVELEGIVSALDPGTGFELLIREIEEGVAIAAPILAGLGNPATIDVSFDGSTVFVLDDDDGPDRVTTSTSLAVGQEVDVSFAVFSSEPFPAFRVEIEDEGNEIEGVLVDVSGLPASVVMHVDDDAYVLAAGLVDSTSTDVTVLLSQATLVLDVDPEVPLVPGELLVGLEVEAKGTLQGPSSGPTVDARELDVDPGELDDAVVVSADAGAGRFQTSGGQVDDPFGGGIATGPLDVVLAPQVSFEGDANSAASFFALFQGLGAGESLVVEVEGIATGQPNEIRAYEIEVERED